MHKTLLLALLLGCNPPAPEAPVVIPGTPARSGAELIVVNGTPITQSMVDDTLEMMPSRAREEIVEGGEFSKLYDSLIVGEILHQAAVEAGVHQDPGFEKRRILAERDAMVEAHLRNVVDPQLTDEAIRAWYDAHPQVYADPKANIAHIMVASEDEAKAALVEIQGGAAFADVAKTKSLDPKTAPGGGVIGWVGPRDLIPALGQLAFSLQPGQVGGPVQTPAGWHLVALVERRDVVPFDDVKGDVRQRLGQEKAQEYVEGLKAKASIERKALATGDKNATVVAPAAGAPAAAAPAEGAPAAAEAAESKAE